METMDVISQILQRLHAADPQDRALKNFPPDIIAAVKLIGQGAEMFPVLLEVRIQKDQRTGILFIITINIIFPQPQIERPFLGLDGHDVL